MKVQSPAKLWESPAQSFAWDPNGIHRQLCRRTPPNLKKELQHWFANLNANSSPFRFYALSNVGSLLALVSYPALVEPALTLPAQTWAWSSTYLVFMGGVIGCVWLVLAHARRSAAAPTAAQTVNMPPTRSAPASSTPHWFVRASWIVLSACGSVMLLAGTNQSGRGIRRQGIFPLPRQQQGGHRSGDRRRTPYHAARTGDRGFTGLRCHDCRCLQWRRDPHSSPDPEASALYWRHLREDGVLALHISNRHIDLSDVVRHMALSVGKEALYIKDDQPGDFYSKSDWVLITSNRAFLDNAYVRKFQNEWYHELGSIVWTDDFSNLFKVVG